MPILTHGSDVSLAPSIKPVVRQVDGTVRGAIDQLARLGFRSVQLDATLSGIRPRDLGERARKDLVALVARAGVAIAGLDVFIPTRHFVAGEHVDRAMSAVAAAIDLAHDLGRLPVSLALPVAKLGDDARAFLLQAADGRGVRLAVHAEGEIDALLKWVTEADQPMLGAAVDPAALLSRAADPSEVVGKFGRRLAVARLSDIAGTSSTEGDAEAAGVRCYVGEGDLDVVGYRVALDLASGRSGPVVLDLRGLENPLAAAAHARAVWEKAAFTV